MAFPLQESRPCVPPGIERLIVYAAREVQVLPALTPVHAHRERARLTAELRAGRRALPNWVYAPVRNDELRRALDVAERILARGDDPYEPHSRLYLARVRELKLEAALCAAAGTGGCAGLSRQRFAPRHTETELTAARLCAAWLRES